MNTLYTVILANGEEHHLYADLPEEPGYDALLTLVHPFIGTNNDMERVNVLVAGQYVDMFVDDSGVTKDLPRNEKATAHYRNNWLAQRPGTDPDDLPWIAGTAVLFHRRVLF